MLQAVTPAHAIPQFSVVRDEAHSLFVVLTTPAFSKAVGGNIMLAPCHLGADNKLVVDYAAMEQRSAAGLVIKQLMPLVTLAEARNGLMAAWDTPAEKGCRYAVGSVVDMPGGEGVVLSNPRNHEGLWHAMVVPCRESQNAADNAFLQVSENAKTWLTHAARDVCLSGKDIADTGEVVGREAVIQRLRMMVQAHLSFDKAALEIVESKRIRIEVMEDLVEALPKQPMAAARKGTILKGNEPFCDPDGLNPILIWGRNGRNNHASLGGKGYTLAMDRAEVGRED